MNKYICGYEVNAEGPEHAGIISMDPATSFNTENYKCIKDLEGDFGFGF